MKKIISLLLVVCFCIGLCACGRDSEQTTESSASTTTEPIETTVPSEPSETTIPTEPPIVYIPVKQGEAIVTENSSEFFIAEVDWVYELEVRDADNHIRRISNATDGNVLMYLKVTYTNKDKAVFDLSQYLTWNFSLTYDSEYTYTPQKVEDVFSGFKLQPLMTGDFYVVFNLPEFFKYDNKALDVSFTVNDVHYSFRVRDEGDAVEMNTSLNIGEKNVIEEKGEITLVQTTTMKKLMPPNASGFYSYFEAREGYTFVVAEFIVKNLGQESIHTSETIEGSVLVDGQPVEGMCVLASGDKSDLSANYSFVVLAEHTAYFIAEVPDDKLSADISFSILYGDEKFSFPFSN